MFPKPQNDKRQLTARNKNNPKLFREEPLSMEDVS
jgi:hypothetical protein